MTRSTRFMSTRWCKLQRSAQEESSRAQRHGRNRKPEKKMPRYNVYIDKIKANCKNQVLSSGTLGKTWTARLMREEISTH